MEPILQAARAAEKTQRVWELLSGRWKVEQGIARLMRRGIRQARYVGQAKVRYQALVTNLVRATNVITPNRSPIPRLETRMIRILRRESPGQSAEHRSALASGPVG